MLGLYRLVEVSRHIKSIDENGVSDTISIDRAAPIQNVIKQNDARNGDQNNPSLNDVHSIYQLRGHLERKLPIDSEYLVYWLVAHNQKWSGTQLKVLWYGYTPKKDTFKPSDYIPSYFITEYWKFRRALWKS